MSIARHAGQLADGAFNTEAKPRTVGDRGLGEGATFAARRMAVGARDLAPNGFDLRHRDDELWLRGARADDDYVYPPAFTEFVLVDAEGSTP